MPFEWGNTGLTYRTDKVPAEDVQSLQVFADPKYEGKISIGDSVDDAYALAVARDRAQGLDADDRRAVHEASDFLRKVHQNVRLYWTDNADISQAMANGEVLIAWTWNETPDTLAAEGQPVAMNRDTKEGLSSWVCGYVRLKGGEGSEDEAYDFLNAIADARVSPYHGRELGLWPFQPRGHGRGRPCRARGQGLCRRREVPRQDPVPGARCRRRCASA